MVDNNYLQIYFPKKERKVLETKDPFNWSRSKNDQLKKKYSITNPNNGETLVLFCHDDNPYCKITGSWRRFFWGKYGAFLGDLNKSQFKEVISIISKILGVNVGTIWSGKFSRLELGFNIKLKREYELFINSMDKYGKLDKMLIPNQTVKFIGSKKSFKCYDKCTQLKHVLKKSQVDRFKNQFLFLRNELEIKSISASRYKEKINTPYDLYRNWNFLLDELYLIIKNDIEKHDVFSEDLDLSNEYRNWIENLKYLAFQGMKSIGFENSLILINNRTKHKTKISEDRKKLYEIWNSHMSSRNSFITNEIYSEMNMKLQRMKY